MIVDTSALIAIIKSEEDAPSYARALDSAPSVGISSATYFEASVVIERRNLPGAGKVLDDLIRANQIRVIDFTAEHADVARRAYGRFGQGSGHVAKLNFGDCFAYATAYVANEPLLFKGHDFAHTDVRPALDTPG